MQIHDLKRRTKNKKRMLVGRGGKKGKTSGRGTKGQNARAGRKKRPELRDIIKKYPKLRGYAFKSHTDKPAIVKIADLELTFKSGDKVNPTVLVEKGLVALVSGRIPKVKILSNGETTKSFTVEMCTVSAGAKVKLEKAGGKIVLSKKI